jgi:hypothetical protein
MENVFTVDDVFTVGIALDLVGGAWLARGLLASPREIMARTASVIGHNPSETDSLVISRADGITGLTS